MRAAHTTARRVGPAAARDEDPKRWRLGKKAWQDIRRARELGDDPSLHAVEIHGVRLTFRWTGAHQPSQETSGGRAAKKASEAGSAGFASAQNTASKQTRPPNARQRRSAKRQTEYVRAWGEWCQHNPEAAASYYDRVTYLDSVRESRTAGAASRRQQQSPAAEGSGEEAGEGCAFWQWRQHQDGHEMRRRGDSGRIWHMKRNCMCPVRTWPCQHMADAEAGSDGEMSDTSGPASDPLMAHYAVHTAEVGGDE